MNVIWILIILTSTYGGATVVTGIEFSDKVKCGRAKDFVESKSNSYRTTAICMPK